MIDRTGDALSLQIPVDIEGGEQRIARTLQRDLVVAERQHRLLQFRPVLKCLLHQRLRSLRLLRNLLEADAVGGNHRRRRKRGIVQVAGNGLLDDLLLVVEGVL